MLGGFIKDMGLDLGTANTLVYVKGQGIVVREPSVVAMEVGTEEIKAVGNEAKAMIGRTPGNIVAIRPMKDGVIADYNTTASMIEYFLKKATDQHYILPRKPNVMVCVPSGVTPVEKRAVEQATIRAGAKDAYTIEEPLAAAIGAGLPVWEATGSMVVDIGGGTTEVAVISLGGIVTSHSLRVAGDKMDDAIIQYIRRKFNLLIGERTAETLKLEIGTALADEQATESREIKGRDLITGLPRMIEITSKDIAEALGETVFSIIDCVKQTLEQTPPELSADILDRGITLTGGGALLHNLNVRLSEETNMECYVAENPLDCVAIGTGSALEQIELFKPNSTMERHRRKRFF